MSNRRDQRAADSFRHISIKLDELERVDGSARFSLGDTAALASVSGPVEARSAIEQASRAALEVNILPLHGVPATESRALATAISALLAPSLLLHQNPRALIQITVQTLSPPPSSTRRVPTSQTAVLINASTLALLRAASVSMCTVICAISVAKRPSGEFFVDPAPEDPTLGSGCFAFDGDDALCWSHWLGTPITQGELAQAIALARTATREVRATIRRELAGAGQNEDVQMSS
ncbi:hypothetical protein AURDEDRAFT_58674 [Auricularia subglabra TFB-10046 SS5]|nr:hypothetical protein AURDEDRAFT_58674 [Auricularia subglabra TFB-10046 SS5]